MFELQQTTIPGSPTPTTRLGFGCSNLLGDKTREVGLSLLHAAYDAGVRHFDVARVYNFGDAEGLVGEFAAGKRDRITITTKFGLAPAGGVAKMKGPVQLVRKLMRSSSFIRKLVRRNVKNMTQAGQFDPASAQTSLETSLRTLKTDYIDLFLLHEGTVPDCTDGLFEFLERSVTEGKIRAFGVGSGYEKMPAIAASQPRFLRAAQFQSSVLEPNIQSFAAVRPTENLLTVTHGAFTAVETLRAKMAADAALARRWNDAVGLDLGHTGTLFGALLLQALHANADGMVLFRAAAASRIESNLRTIGELKLSEAQFAALAAIGHEVGNG